MKTKSTLIVLASVLLVGTVVLTVSTINHVPRESDSASQANLMRKAPRPLQQKTSKPVRKTAGPKQPAASTLTEELDEEVNLAGWEQRFQSLLAANGTRAEAVALLRSELDSVFAKWVQERIVPLASVPPSERYDALEIIDASVREGAAAILDMLEIPGSRQISVAAGALEAVAAEIQYAEAAPDHAARLAMLRLDRNREQRYGEVLALADETAQQQAMSELEGWYQSALATIFPADEVN